MHMIREKLAALRRQTGRISLAWSWQFVTSAIIIAAGIALLYFHQLGSLLPGYSADEVAMATASQSFSTIAADPVNAPFKLLVYGLHIFGFDLLLATRLASAIIGTLTLALFYIGVRHWHTKRVAFLAAVLFACSGWFLQVARSGTGDSMLPFVALLFATSGYWVASVKHRSALSHIAVIVALSLSVFVPGVIWLVLLGLLVRRGKDLAFIRRRLSLWQQALLASLLLVFVVLPLAYGIVQTPSSVMALLALPASMPSALAALQDTLAIPVSLIAWSHLDSALWLNGLPLLDAFTAAMLLLGMYHAGRNWRLHRSQLLLGLLVIGSLLVGLGGLPLAALIPAVFVLAAGGIAVLLNRWLTIFPRNPLARSLGILLVTIAVGASVFFNFRAYFIAWPHNTDTKAAYSYNSVTIDD